MTFALAFGYIIVAIIWAIPAVAFYASIMPRVQSDAFRMIALGLSGFFILCSGVAILKLMFLLTDDFAKFVSNVIGG